MAKFSLSRPETQARVAALLSLFSCLSLAALAALVLRHLDTSQWVITYGRSRSLMVQAAAGVTFLLAGIGFGMGLSSAGQRQAGAPDCRPRRAARASTSLNAIERGVRKPRRAIVAA